MTRYQSTAFAIIVAVGLLACCAVAYLLGRHDGRKAANLPVNIRVDTLTIRDTIREKYPVEIVKYKDRVELVAVTDTVRRTDTLYMALEIERKTYQSDDYRAVVSGWHPVLEDIAVFPKTQIITIHEQAAPVRQHWGASVTGGPAVVFNGKWHAGLGVALGLSYNF